MKVSNCNFKNNYAELSGGAIYWVQIQPKLSNNIIVNNSGKLYGNDYAGPAHSLQ
jgi:predicted outer membrane repeat protein